MKYWIKKNVLLFNINDYPELKDMSYDTLVKYLKKTIITINPPYETEAFGRRISYFTKNGGVIGKIKVDIFGNCFGNLELIDKIFYSKPKVIKICFSYDENETIAGIDFIQIGEEKDNDI